CGQSNEALPGSLQQLVFDLHGGHQRLAHRLDRYELDDVQQFDFRARCARQRLPSARDGQAALGQIDDDQDTAIDRHTLESSPRLIEDSLLLRTHRQSSCSASSLKAAGASVSGRAPGSRPQAWICSRLTTPLRALRSVLRRWEKAAATTPAKRGLTLNEGARRTVSRATADHTFGGGRNAPGPTSKSSSTSTHGAIMIVRRP